MTEDLSRREVEQLSLYLDGELSPKEAADTEALLTKNAEARRTLEEFSATRMLMRSLPEVRPPRNFGLTPEMAGIREKSTAYPIFRFATAIAAVGFVILVGLDVLVSGATLGARAPAMDAQMDLAAPAAELAPVDEAMKSVVEEEMALEALGEVADSITTGEDGYYQENAAQEGRAAAEEPAHEEAEGEALSAEPESPLPSATQPPPSVAEGEDVDMAAGDELDEAASQSPDEEAFLLGREVMDSRTEIPSFRVSLFSVVRILEISLGLVIIVLAGLTLFLRRRS